MGLTIGSLLYPGVNMIIIFITVDHTRIVLRDGDPQVIGSDYINANLITVSSYMVCLCSYSVT